MIPPKEDLTELGRRWGHAKSRAMDALLVDEGRTGQKRSVKRVAMAAGVSVDFVRSLRGYEARWEHGVPVSTNRERSKVLAVLGVLDVNEEQFLNLALERAE